MFNIFKRKGKESKELSLLEAYKLSKKLYEDFDLFIFYYRSLSNVEKEAVSDQIEIFIKNAEFNLAYMRDAVKVGAEIHIQKKVIERLKKGAK